MFGDVHARDCHTNADIRVSLPLDRAFSPIQVRDTFWEWPFFAYGLSDKRPVCKNGTRRILSSTVNKSINQYSNIFFFKLKILSIYSNISHIPLTRWSSYVRSNASHDAPAVFGLDAAVTLINWNDAGLGVLVLMTYVLWRRWLCVRTRVAFYLLLLFRDATLWRETVEYMWDHHRCVCVCVCVCVCWWLYDLKTD